MTDNDGPKPHVAMLLAKAVSRQHRKTLFTDVTIEVEGKIFKSHRFILSAYSDYFEAMFSSDMREATEQHVSLKDISADTFEVILEMIFESRNLITADNAMGIWRAADMFLMRHIVSMCLAFLKDNINHRNCFEVHRQALLLEDRDISRSMYLLTTKYILDNYKELRDFDSCKSTILNYDLDNIKDMLEKIVCRKRPGFEDIALTLAFDWVCHDPSQEKTEQRHLGNRYKYLLGLLRKCSLLTAGREALRNAVTRLEQLKDFVDVEDIKSVLSRSTNYRESLRRSLSSSQDARRNRPTPSADAQLFD